METIFIHESVIGVIDAMGIWLAFLVYRQNPKGKINRLFVIMVALMFIWVTLAAGSRVLAFYGLDLAYSLLVLKIAWFATPLLFLALYFFSIFAIKEEKKYALLTKLVFLSGILAAFSVFTNLILADVKFSENVFSPVYGKGLLPFLAVIAFAMIATLYILFKKYFRLSGKEKAGIQFLLIGAGIFYLANMLFNIFLPMVLRISQHYWIGDYSLIFLLGFLAYSIIRHEFLGTKVILTQSLVALISILLLVNLIGSETVFEYIWKGVILIFFLFAGLLLIKSVLREIKLKEELAVSNKALSELNETLEQKVKERTAEIEKRKADLEKFYKLLVGRELRMIELKKEIKKGEKEIKELEEKMRKEE